eukprot:1148188-Pelagomonas_calceolata.AAC.5
MTHSRQQQQKGSSVGPVQQGLAGARRQATCPDDPGSTPASTTISLELSCQMERWKTGIRRDLEPVLEA